MVKRTRREVMKAILEVLKDGKEYSYGSLERKVDTNWNTIRDHIDDLVLFGAVDVGEKVRITEDGRKILKKIG